jgi:hypothetical protein
MVIRGLRFSRTGSSIANRRDQLLVYWLTVTITPTVCMMAPEVAFTVMGKVAGPMVRLFVIPGMFMPPQPASSAADPVSRSIASMRLTLPEDDRRRRRRGTANISGKRAAAAVGQRRAAFDPLVTWRFAAT